MNTETIEHAESDQDPAQTSNADEASGPSSEGEAKPTKPRWKRWLLDASLVLVVVMGIFWWQTRHLIDDGVPAPPFSGETLDGEVYNLADYRGQKVVLVFWAPWCTVCGAESGTIQNVADDADAAVLSVVLSYEDHASVRGFIEEYDVTYPVILGSREIGSEYKITSFPTLYILDEEGRVEDTMVGYTTEIGLRARLAL